MPLTEFLRMSKVKVDATQQRASTSTNPSSRLDTDCVELVWENGQIMMQGQSSKARKGPNSNNFQTLVPKPQDVKHANGSKMAKFSTIDSGLADFALPVPSCEMGLDQDDDIVPWLSYPIDDHLHNDSTSDFLRELSGVTMNDLSTNNHLAFKEKKTSFHGNNHKSGCNEVPQYASRDSIDNPSSPSSFANLRLQKLDSEQPSTSYGFTNFPHFSALSRPNHLAINTSKRSDNGDKKCPSSSNNPDDCTPVNPNNSKKGLVSHNRKSELLPVNQAICGEYVAKIDESKNTEYDTTMMNWGTTSERNMEPVVQASSVCSGNSVERASDEPRRHLKRKSRETGESEGPSEEVEEESVGGRKANPSRGGSKRSRAAEVHNLSERRRRDRINEKMRALQELIPNCNKVDKASMLDEAIEYLKTLQLQVQILSMGAGLYMQPMMLPPGMPPGHMPHFSPMGVGLGLGMGYGPYPGPHYPVQPAFHGMPGSSLQAFGHSLGQGLPMSVNRPPLLSASGCPPLKIPVGVNVSGVARTTVAPHLASSSSSKDVGTQIIPNNRHLHESGS